MCRVNRMPCEQRQRIPRAAPLILASRSPRRAALLRESGFEFTVVNPPLREPERLPGDPAPAQLAEAVSFFKARSAADTVNRGVILAGDTVVALGNRFFGKPEGLADARRILRRLAGTTHQVITGVALVDASTGERFIQHDSTAVTMRTVSEEDLDVYLDTGAWVGKAGAYGIQDDEDPFVEHLEGSFTNVVGLPMELVIRMLGAWNISATGVAAEPV